MNPLENSIIESLLEINDKNIVVEGENEKLEFKVNFNRASKEAKVKYCKELAAFYNSKGGYLIFGVNDETNELVGLNDFTEPDSADIANDINEYFKPTFDHRQKTLTIKGKTIFAIYVAPRIDIPTVCIRTHQDVVKESTIFYRYSSQSAPIHAEDLIKLLMELKLENSTELAEKNIAIDYKPKINRGLSGLKDGAAEATLTNEGKRFEIKSVQSTNKAFQASFYAKLPYWFEPGVRLALRISTSDGSLINDKTFEANMIVQNELGHDYSITFTGKGGQIKISEPTLI
jgi:hypothetical protein